MEYSKNDKTVNNFNLNKTIKLVASIITSLLELYRVEFQNKLINERKEIIKYLEEIGE